MPVASHPIRNRLFHQFFPPPKFLEMPAVGLAISDDAIRALELVRRKGAYAVGRFGERALPPGAIAGGYVNDRDAVIGELRTLKTELRLNFVNASLSEEKAYLFKTSVPRLPVRELRGALEFTLEENVPIPAGEAIFDYTVITEAGHTDDGHLDVSVTVLPKKVVETYADIVKASGLAPLSFEIEAQAIARAVVASGDRETYLVVNLGEEKSGLFLVSDEVVHFTSTVGIGGIHITDAIAKFLSIGREEAERLKREPEAFGGKKHMDLLLALVNALSALKDEINKLSMYWHTHTEPQGEPPKRIAKVILSGRDAAFPGLAEYLGLALAHDVVVGSVWNNVFSVDDYVPALPFADSLGYAAAVGLALPKSH